jgi:hypothetical protein
MLQDPLGSTPVNMLHIIQQRQSIVVQNLIYLIFITYKCVLCSVFGLKYSTVAEGFTEIERGAGHKRRTSVAPACIAQRAHIL